MQKNKQKKKSRPLTLGWKRRRRRRRNWFCCCQDCEMASGGVRGVSISYWKKLVKAWRWRHGASQCQSLTPSCSDEMRWDEWQFYAILRTLMQSVLQKKWWCVRKRFSSNFLNDKIVIVILIGLWLSQAGSMDTISWMIKMYLFFHLYTFLLKICLSFIGHFAEVYVSYESSRAKMYLIPTGPQSLKVVKDTLLIRFYHQNIHLKFHESFSGFFFFQVSVLIKPSTCWLMLFGRLIVLT